MKLGEYVKFQNGYAFKSKDFVVTGEYKVIKIKEIKDGIVKFFSDTASIDCKMHDGFSKYLVFKGDVLFALTGDPVNKPNPLSWVGRVAIYLHEEPALLNQRVCKLLPNKGVNAKYIYYYFRQFENFYDLAAKATGSASQANISTKLIESVDIDLPERIIQDKIVEWLDSISDKIEINEKINDNLQQQVMALYRQMFIENTNAARRECRADEYFDISIGKTPPRKEPQWFSENSADHVWVSISDMGSCGLFIANSLEYLTHEAVEKFNVKVVPDNTVLLSFKLTVGRIAITDGAMVTNEAIAHFKTNKPEINEYLFCYLKDFN